MSSLMLDDLLTNKYLLITNKYLLMSKYSLGCELGSQRMHHPPGSRNPEQ